MFGLFPVITEHPDCVDGRCSVEVLPQRHHEGRRTAPGTNTTVHVSADRLVFGVLRRISNISAT